MQSPVISASEKDAGRQQWSAGLKIEPSSGITSTSNCKPDGAYKGDNIAEFILRIYRDRGSSVIQAERTLQEGASDTNMPANQYFATTRTGNNDEAGNWVEIIPNIQSNRTLIIGTQKFICYGSEPNINSFSAPKLYLKVQGKTVPSDQASGHYANATNLSGTQLSSQQNISFELISSKLTDMKPFDLIRNLRVNSGAGANFLFQFQSTSGVSDLKLTNPSGNVISWNTNIEPTNVKVSATKRGRKSHSITLIVTPK
ncbi:hypothetical protein [Escherichia coli]|uniref:hypothetical protein n=1 Tax=Escherichia coli TaxID=562 RepID=UPI0021D2CB13|nr:hypothetical protein [Escherichia coli]MCU6469737.1 hypothetical protein [Escherichia coli]